ncbi:hypothetical protein Tsubulata_004686 [Turnera subulata]|uniref:R3H domain-containing protein n=1 Tax=Turnera subulata TaxID=218843 RepID=A0A9Q0FP79_9ROSI|nr:hypothetical protein Tsubulata_004686 [Turnera subulata]
MPATDYHHHSTFGRSILSVRREQQVHSLDNNSSHHHHQEAGLEMELECFQKHVTQRFTDLSSAGPEHLLSLPWIRDLLDAFLCCQEEFRAILFNNKHLVSRPPLDRMVQDFFDRAVKALDLCNAIRDGIEQIRDWKKLLDIVLCALHTNSNHNSNASNTTTHHHRMLGEGQFRRARKALIDLSVSMLDEKDSSSSASSIAAHRNRSFGRQKDHHHHRLAGHFRSLSWSVSRSWSAARQLQAIGNNLVAPKGSEVIATGGVAVAVYTMNSVLLFAMWALVAGIPCQDRGLQVHFSVPRQLPWAAPMMSLHERVLEESRKRERRNACGLLREIYRMDKCARAMADFADSVQFPLAADKEGEVRQRVEELKQVSEVIKEGLDPLERQVREVFHRIVHSRTEGLDTLGRPNHL